LKYKFPDHFSEEAKDLIKKLIVIEPSGRLGAGEKGGSNDF
jgi:3-phosphoinositide dependent protein kinase-1